MHIARPSSEHARPHLLPDARRAAPDIAATVVDALDRLCANSHRDEWNAFLLDIRQETPGMFRARVGIFGPIQGELTIDARLRGEDNTVSSTVVQAVTAWIAKYDRRVSPPHAVHLRAATALRGNRLS